MFTQHLALKSKLYFLVQKLLSTPGIEAGLSRPQRDVLTARRCGLYNLSRKTYVNDPLRILKGTRDSSGVRTHALSDQRLKLAP